MSYLKYQSVLPGISPIIGGLLWIVGMIITASRPFLPPDDYRDNDDLAILMGVSMLFMAGGIVCVYLRQKSKMTLLGRVAVYTGVIGAVLAMIGSVLITIHGSSISLVPFFYGGGTLLLLLGITLTGFSVLRAQIMPRWSGGLLIGSVILGLAGDENSSNVFLLLGLGIAWIVIGVILSFARSSLQQNALKSSY